MLDKSKHTDQSILFFDGVCNLCDGFVQWVIRRDPEAFFYFASLQSDFAKEFTSDSPLDVEQVNTVILYHQGRFYSESDVALEIAKQLGFPWVLLYPFKLLPRIIRDGIYRWIAGNRYRWFGKQETCMIPAPSLQSRFLG